MCAKRVIDPPAENAVDSRGALKLFGDEKHVASG
jgi:hypothetical protein